MAQIYISYRRLDTSDIAGRIYDRLAKEFGDENVFRDFESVEPGQDFGNRMLEETKQCKVLIVVIGVEWLNILDNQGTPKIHNPQDWIYREIEIFLRRLPSGALIFPVLVNGAYMPSEAELPRGLSDFADCFAISVRGGREFHQDMTALVNVISKNVSPKTSGLGKDIFIVHGHDKTLRESVARLVERQGLRAIILAELPNLGRTIIEKFEEEAQNVGYAIVLLTPDDLGNVKNQEANLRERARQNVIFELGYFVSKLGRGRVCLLYKNEVEIPSDLYGVLYTEIDTGDSWRFRLAKEMKASGIAIDLNNI